MSRESPQVLRQWKQAASMLFVSLALLSGCDGGSPGTSAPSMPSQDDPPTSPIDQTLNLQEDTSIRADFGRPLDIDIESWQASFALNRSPRFGELEITPNLLSFEYTPELNFAGVDRFFYSVDEFAEVSVTLVVENINDAPTIEVEILRVIEQGETYASRLSVSDPDENDTHRYSAENLPNWITLNESTGRLNGNPEQADVGRYNDISFTVTDSAGEYSMMGGVSIEVLDINDAPTLNLSQFPEELLARQSVSISVFPDDPDGEGVTVRVEENDFIETSVNGTIVELTVSDVVEVIDVNLVIVALDSRGQESRAIAPLTLRPLSVTGRGITLHGRGSGIGVHLVVIGDGYREDQTALFREHVETLVDTMRDDPGINKHFDAWNIHMLTVPSVDSGIDDNLDNDFRDTAFDSAYFCLGIPRLICGDQVAMFDEALDDYPNLDQLVMLVNDRRYGGSGGSVAIASAYYPEIALHELGHSVAGLADEYVDTLIPDVSSLEYQEGRYANVSRFDDPRRVPWSHWVEDPENYPTSPGQAGIGVFEGGFYQANSYYRPTFDSRMRTFDSDFGPVNSEQWALSLYGLTNPVHEFSPVEQILTLQAGQTQTFTVEPLFGPDIQEITWRLNGEVVASGDEARTIRIGAPVGIHTLDLTVHDVSGLIRREPPANGQFEWSWRISVQ